MLKNILYSKYNFLADLIPVKSYSFITGRKFLPVFYHAVSDTPLPHLDYLYKVRSTREFEKDLDFLLKYYQPIDLKTLTSSIKEKKTFTKPSFFLSIDDGLLEFHDIAAPVLLKKGIPATCFLNSAFIDNKEMFYRYKVNLLIHKLKSANNDKLYEVNTWLKSQDIHPSQANNFLLALDYQNRFLIDDLAKLLDYDFGEYLRTQQPYLTTSQIESLIQKGFTFGAHSIDHPNYNTLSFEDQITQTIESTKIITEKFRLSYNVFSFPFTDFGISKTFFDNINKSLKFDATFGCAGIKKDIHENHIQRIPLEEYPMDARKRIKRDYFYYILKVVLNLNTIKRN